MCVCGLQSAYPQTHTDAISLSFEVKDSTTLEPLVGVTCRVYSSSGKFYSYGISDKKGLMKLQTHLNDWLSFRFWDMRNKKSISVATRVQEHTLFL